MECAPERGSGRHPFLVERLAALIARQAEQAQFMVVSHRRPMIGAAQRTIGVTQARGAHTQVVGLPDAA